MVVTIERLVAPAWPSLGGLDRVGSMKVCWRRAIAYGLAGRVVVVGTGTVVVVGDVVGSVFRAARSSRRMRRRPSGAISRTERPPSVDVADEPASLSPPLHAVATRASAMDAIRTRD